jgi:hypothetical protein
MIEVRTSFEDAYLNSMGYVEHILESAGFPPYALRGQLRGITKHWWEDPPGVFVYQWIPYEEYSTSKPGGE